MEYSDTIAEFIENELIASMNELPDDVNLLENLLQNEMAILHLKELKAISKLSEIALKIVDLSVLEDYSLTIDKAIEILELQGMHEDALRAKFAKELGLMTEEQQESKELIIQELTIRDKQELIDFYNHQLSLESEILGDNNEI